MMRFEDLNFKTQSTLAPEPSMQALMNFGQYRLSVLLEYGKTTYEVAIFKDDMFAQLPGIHPDYGNDWSDDVIPGLSPTDVSTIMLKLSLIEMRPKEVDIHFS